MATMDQPQLRIDADITGANPHATLTVNYTVQWSDYDRQSHQPYEEVWVIWGADQQAGEDGVDDRIVGLGALGRRLIASDGSASSDFEIVIERDVADLDEDFGAAQDEIKVEVVLEPKAAARVSELSHRVLIAA